MKKLLTNKLIAVIIPAAVFFTGCGKDEDRTEFVAKVNNTYLTSDELNSIIESDKAGNFYTGEVIRNWINRELLYQEALRQGIIDNNEFKKLIEISQKELAAAMLLNKVVEKEKFSAELKEVQEYFDTAKDEFKLTSDAFLVSIINFSDEDKAIRFRTTVLESDWNKALNVHKTEQALMNEETGKLFYDYEIHPAALLRLLNQLQQQEVSIVVSSKPGTFTVVQLIDKYIKGSIPPFEIVKDQVTRRLLAVKKEAFINNYLKELYAKSDIEIKKQE